jgi:hypothetical protein
MLVRRSNTDHALGLLLELQQEPLRGSEQDGQPQERGGGCAEVFQGGLQGGELQHAGGLEQGDEDQAGPSGQRAQDRRAEQRRPRASVGDRDALGEHQSLHPAHQPTDRPGDQQHPVAESRQHRQREQGDKDDPGCPVVQPRQLGGLAVGRLVDLPEQLVLDLFADDAQVYFPKWGLATGKEQIGKLLTDVGGTLKWITHDYATFNWILSGGDMLACEGTSYGEHQDGRWWAAVPYWGAGRWCNVFEIRDFLIQRCFTYLDPDYAGGDTARYPWLAAQQPQG